MTCTCSYSRCWVLYVCGAVVGEVKTLMVQLLRGVAHLHDNWIIHRDLKTSNLLFSHKGVLKVSRLFRFI